MRLISTAEKSPREARRLLGSEIQGLTSVASPPLVPSAVQDDLGL